MGWCCQIDLRPNPLVKISSEDFFWHIFSKSRYSFFKERDLCLNFSESPFGSELFFGYSADTGLVLALRLQHAGIS